MKWDSEINAILDDDYEGNQATNSLIKFQRATGKSEKRAFYYLVILKMSGIEDMKRFVLNIFKQTDPPPIAFWSIQLFIHSKQ